ncbi:MAG TPA: twin-arginine translocase subunit TatC [Actinomycetota bacterium]|nr:twin-arginine translocase subunit TatC [Actinomycetota bacterium]
MAVGERRRRLRRWSLRRRKRTRAAVMTVVEHLDELRRRLILSAVAFVLFATVAFFFFDEFSDFLLRPLCGLPREQLGPNGCRLVIGHPIEGFTVRLKVSAMGGLVAASPVWLYHLWAFVVPALTPSEKRYALPFVTTSVTLFAIGATFAYLTLQTGLRFLFALGGDNFVPFLRAQEYLDFVGLVLVAFGVTFELPLILFFLGLAGAVSVDQLRRGRRIAAVSITALAAVVTPSQDPYTMLVMAVPLYVLYEATIALLALVIRRRNRRPAQPSATR